MVGASEQAAGARPRAQGKDVLAAQPTPDLAQAHSTFVARVGGDEGGINGPHRGADQEIRADACFGQGLQHADLHRAEAPAPGEDKGRATGPPSANEPRGSVVHLGCWVSRAAARRSRSVSNMTAASTRSHSRQSDSDCHTWSSSDSSWV